MRLKKEKKNAPLQDVVKTHVVVSRDHSPAKVFFSVEEKKKKISSSLLNKASGFFRSRLSKELDLRHTPSLSFIYDTAPNTGARMDKLLKKL
jgi:ribosome-binding factor A